MPRAVAANSGTSSLHLSAMVAGIKPGDEVLVPALTFIAAVNPVTRYMGAEPVFIGCDDSGRIDLYRLLRQITFLRQDGKVYTVILQTQILDTF